MIQSTGDLITFALRVSGINGVGQTPSAEDSNTGLQLLHDLLAEWQRKRWLVPSEIDMALVSTGAQSYTVGPSRPDKLLAAYVRLINSPSPTQVDIPLAIIGSREDYSAITVKNLSTFPAAVFYDSAWPTANVYVWPIPPAGLYEIHLIFVAPLPIYSTLTDALDLPPEYTAALCWSLAVRLQMAYGLPARQDHVAAMNESMNVIRMANVQMSEARMPADLNAAMGGGGVAAGSSPAFQGGGWW